MMYKIILFVFALLMGFPPLVHAENIRFLTEDFPPFGYVQEGNLQGIGPEIVREMMALNGVTQHKIEVLPWKRAYRLAQSKPNIGLFSVSRLKSREDQFKWIGPLYTMQSYLFARSDFQGEIKSLKDARLVSRILVQAGGASETELKSLGFTNLMPVLEPDRQLKMLLSGRADLVFTTGAAILYQLEKIEQQVSVIKPVLRVRSGDFYLTFSTSTSDKTVENWRQALEKLRASGKLDEIRARYQMAHF